MRTEKLLRNVFVHYGHKNFDRNLFVVPKNRMIFNKPEGGLWASPEDSSFGWKQWNEQEEFRPCREDECFRFRLRQDAKVFVIDSVEKAKTLPQLKMPEEFSKLEAIYSIMGYVYPDFERIMEDYDALLYLQTSDPGLYNALYGWDCDSILVLNPDVIEL